MGAKKLTKGIKECGTTKWYETEMEGEMRTRLQGRAGEARGFECESHHTLVAVTHLST